MPPTPRLTLSGVTAWMNGGLWVDGYAYGSARARPVHSTRSFDDWRGVSESTGSMLRRTNTAGGHTSMGPRLHVQEMEPRATGMSANPERQQSRGHREPFRHVGAGAVGAAAACTRRGCLPAGRVTPSQTFRTPYSVYNESIRAVARADWFWNTEAGHANELQHPIATARPAGQRFDASTRPASARASLAPSKARLSHDWVTGPRRVALCTAADATALVA